MPANTDSADAGQDRIEVLIAGNSPDLSECVQQGLDGVPHRLTRIPGLDGARLCRPEGVEINPQIALVEEEGEAGFTDRLRDFRNRHARCQIILVGREDSLLSPRQTGGATVRHWFFRPLEKDALEGVLQAAGRSLSRDWRQRHRHTRSLAGFDRLLGSHPRMTDLLDLAARVSRSSTTGLLIQGETGTGKGMLARAVHSESPRREGPFVDVNCAAIPESLLETELFGHVSGAFTSAHRDKPGLLELADGGTAFLDEIGELDPLMQVKILKFLDNGVIRRVQGTETLKVDVRVIAATNRDLRHEVNAGRFRPDLYHRLSVVVLEMPPLRERPDDIPLLARHFLDHFARRLQGSRMKWSHGALDLLINYSWPGNVRELINLCERIVLLAKGSEIVGAEDLPIGIAAPPVVYSMPSGTDMPEVSLPEGGISFDDVERAVLETALSRNDGNVTRAAAFLQMGRGSLRYRLDRLGLSGKASSRRGRPMGRRRKAA